MRYRTRHFVFHRIYEMASLVESCVKNPRSLVEINWENPDVVKSISIPSKTSLVHNYIYAMISVEQRYDLRGNDDIYEENEEERDFLESTFDAFNVDYLPYKEFIVTGGDDNANDYPFRMWYRSQEANFEFLWERMTDEVFHLLFANRSFLLQFNQSLAAFLKSGNVIIPEKYLNAAGVVKRAAYVPTWVKRAIYYRDQGQCVLCQRDLTGLLSTDQRIHYDHMVPLNLWGTNDPCNLQLLCEDCNLKKSGTLVITAARYYPWWDY